MKRLDSKRSVILTLITLTLSAGTTQAQLLKRLKDKAKSVAQSAVSDVTGTNTQGNQGGSSSSGSSATSSAGSYDPSPYSRLAIELEDKETIVYGEASLAVSAGKETVKFITRKNGQYYLYENAAKSGPFSKPPVEKLGNWQRSSGDIERGNAAAETPIASYLKQGADGKQSLFINGKTYGPYLTVASLQLAPNKQDFFAIVTKEKGEDFEYYLLSNKSSFKIPSMPDKMLVTDDFKNAALLITATRFNARTFDDQLKVVPNDDYYAIFSDGTKAGPMKGLQPYNCVIAGPGKVAEVKGADIYVNGNKALTLGKSLSVGKGLFLNSQGTSAAYYDYDGLYFSDGQHIPAYNVVYPTLQQEGDKSNIYWLSFTRSKVHVCRREI